MEFKVVKTTVRSGRMLKKGTAKSARKKKQCFVWRKRRALTRVWKVEPVQELKAEFGVDLIDELTEILMKEISNG